MSGTTPSPVGRRRRGRLALLLAAVLVWGGTTAAVADEPPLPPGAPSGGEVSAAAAFMVDRSETSYTSITPCRIVDTRSAGGVLNGTARTFYASGTTQFVTQGGKSGGCGIPHSATSVAISITTVNATNHGWLVAYPTGAALPTATSMNFSGDRKSTTSLVAKLGSGTGKRLTLRNFEANTHVIIDVTGYYAEQMTGMIAPDGTLYHQTLRVTGSTRVSTGVYRVSFDRPVDYCLAVATPYYGAGYYASAYAFNANQITIYNWKDTGSGPQLVDYYTYFGVIC